jgi:tetratricopeptide (TPR) repeat protein
VLAGLRRLVDTSFVLADIDDGGNPPGPDGAARYRLLETLREYGRERLAVDSVAAARLRSLHLAYHLELIEAVVEASGEHRLLALRRLDAARDDLWVALGWIRDGADAVASRRLDRALVRLAPTVADSQVRHTLGPLLAEARRLGLSAYAAFRSGLLEQTDPAVLAAGVTLYWVIGDHEAQTLLLGRLEQVEQEPGAADRVVLRRARLHLLHDSVREGLTLLDDVERSALARGDEMLLLDVRLERGYAHTHTGDCGQGGRTYDEALTLLERLRPGLAPTAYLERRLVAVRGRGFVAHNADDNARCAACQREAHSLADALGDGPEMVRALHNLADAQYGCGDYGAALQIFQRAQAASATASFALASASNTFRSSLRASFGEATDEGSKSLTSAATRTG